MRSDAESVYGDSWLGTPVGWMGDCLWFSSHGDEDLGDRHWGWGFSMVGDSSLEALSRKAIESTV
jgi:hypothetical protein